MERRKEERDTRAGELAEDKELGGTISGYPVTRLCHLLVSVILFLFTYGSGPPPLFPPLIVPPSSLSSANSPARVSLSSFLLSVCVSLSAVRPYD